MKKLLSRMLFLIGMGTFFGFLTLSLGIAYLWWKDRQLQMEWHKRQPLIDIEGAREWTPKQREATEEVSSAPLKKDESGAPEAAAPVSSPQESTTTQADKTGPEGAPEAKGSESAPEAGVGEMKETPPQGAGPKSGEERPARGKDTKKKSKGKKSR